MLNLTDLAKLCSLHDSMLIACRLSYVNNFNIDDLLNYSLLNYSFNLGLHDSYVTNFNIGLHDTDDRYRLLLTLI